MADSQVPVIVASIAAASVSAISVLAVSVKGWRERTHDRTMRREERRQERLERTYLALIEYVEYRISVAAARRPLHGLPAMPSPTDV